MCQTACPVGIDTGSLTKRLRGERAGLTQTTVWDVASRHWGVATRVIGTGLTVASVLPDVVTRGPNRVARAVVGHEAVPAWSADLPGGGRRLDAHEPAEPAAIYFPSCVNTMFGPSAGADGVRSALLQLCALAGVAVSVPEGTAGLCCGTPWTSKGLRSGADLMQRRLVAWAQKATDAGRLPVICDASSCTEGLIEALQRVSPEAGALIRVIDAVEFAAIELLPRLAAPARLASLTLHPTCSSGRLGVDTALRSIGAFVAEEVVVPVGWGCCAFAGDRGMLHPELTREATRHEATEVRSDRSEAYASCNRTCEIGMTRATGFAYQHILEVLAGRYTPAAILA